MEVIGEGVIWSISEKGLMFSVSLMRLNVDKAMSRMEEKVENVKDEDGKSKVDSVGGVGDV
jgi:hypothetical protein